MRIAGNRGIPRADTKSSWPGEESAPPFGRRGDGGGARAALRSLLLCAPLAALAVSPRPAAAQIEGTAGRPSCLAEIAKAEQRYHIPARLLVAVGLAESGRRDPASRMVAPWPWTLNAQGTGHFYDSADEAAREAAKLLDRNIGVVDVGCMQVDLFHHPHAFPTLRAAFDPAGNVDFAAQYLRRLYENDRSWPSAVAAYHAGDPAKGADYLARVLYYWKDQRVAVGHARGFSVEESPRPLDLASDFFVRKHYASALAIYRAALNSTPDDVTALLGAAQCLRELGRAEDARSQLERALAVDPTNRLALDILLRLIAGQPPEQRLTHLLSARQVAPGNAEIPARIAMLEAGRGRLAEALLQMADAVRLAPDNPAMLLDYALLLDRSGKAMEAIQAYGRFLRTYRPGTVALTVPLSDVKQRYAYLQSIGH